MLPDIQTRATLFEGSWTPSPCLPITVVFRKSTEQRWNDTDRGMRDVLEEKPVPVPLCLPQTPHGQAWDWNHTPVVTGWCLNTPALVQPSSKQLTKQYCNIFGYLTGTSCLPTTYDQPVNAVDGNNCCFLQASHTAHVRYPHPPTVPLTDQTLGLSLLYLHFWYHLPSPAN